MRTRTDRLRPTTRVLLRVTFLGAATGALLLLAPAAANALETDADPATSLLSDTVDTVANTVDTTVGMVDDSVGDVTGSVGDVVDGADDTVGDVVDGASDTIADVDDTVDDVVDDVASDLGEPNATPNPGDDPPPAGPDSPVHPPAGEEGSGSGSVRGAVGVQAAGGVSGADRSGSDSTSFTRGTVAIAPAQAGDGGGLPLDPVRPPFAPAPGSTGYGDPRTAFPIGLAAMAIGVLALLHAAILWLRMTDDRGPADPFLTTGDRPG
jgi:uncharacterized protein YjbJ (UPF0337 family)